MEIEAHRQNVRERVTERLVCTSQLRQIADDQTLNGCGKFYSIVSGHWSDLASLAAFILEAASSITSTLSVDV